MGEEGYLKLLTERKVGETFRNLQLTIQKVFTHCQEKLKEIAKKYGERVLVTPNNKISIGKTKF